MSETTLFELGMYGLTEKDLLALASITRKVAALSTTGAEVRREINGSPFRLTFGYDSTGKFSLLKAVVEEGP